PSQPSSCNSSRNSTQRMLSSGSLRLEMHKLQNDVTSIIHRVDKLDSDVRDNAVKTANGLKLAQACLDDQLDSHGSLLRDVIKRVDKIEKTLYPASHLPIAASTPLSPAVQHDHDIGEASPSLSVGQGTACGEMIQSSNMLTTDISHHFKVISNIPNQDQFLPLRVSGSRITSNYIIINTTSSFLLQRLHHHGNSSSLLKTS
ncbi:hypothetical protein BaRGS_00033064, partial [Batillaria attramentaria]